MLIEKYMSIPVEVPTSQYDSETYWEEVEVSESDLRHYIDTYLSAEDVLDYAKMIAPESFTDKNSADIDLAYDILVNEFDEHDDIPDFKALNEWVQDYVIDNYTEEARERVIDGIESEKDADIEWSHYIQNNMPR